MGHKNKKSLTRQVQEAFECKLRTGQSKHRDKHDGVQLRNIEIVYEGGELFRKILQGKAQMQDSRTMPAVCLGVD